MSRDARLVLALALASAVLTPVAVVKVRRDLSAAAGPAKAATPPAGEAIRYARVRRAQVAPPARFSAALPRVREWEEREDARYPPLGHVQDLLCRGDDAMWRRAGEAIAASGDVGWREVARTYGTLVRYCPGDGCFAVERVSRGAPASAAVPAWMRLARCPGARADALFLRPDVPPPAVLARAQSSRSDGAVGAPPRDRVAAAAKAVILAHEGGETRAAAFELARLGPEGTEALLALHAREDDAGVRHDLAMALGRSGDRRARALFLAACGRRHEWLCDRDGVPPDPALAATSAPPPEKLVSRLRALGLIPASAARPLAGADAANVLASAGRAYALELELDEGPGSQDSALRALAALAPDPELGGALFEEVTPPGDGGGQPTLLHAYLGGERFTAVARVLDDEYDVEALVGLLNAAARGRGRATRWMALAPEGGTVTVVAGPEAALRAAVAEGLVALPPADADPAARERDEERAFASLDAAPRAGPRSR